MKTLKFALFFLAFTSIAIFTSCDDDDEHDHGDGSDVTTAITIMQPVDDSSFMSGDTAYVQVNFNRSDASTIHHVSVVIMNMTTQQEVFNLPDDYHVHDEDGHFEQNGGVILPTVTEHNHFKLTARSWGHDGMDDNAVEETVEFHLMP